MADNTSQINKKITEINEKVPPGRDSLFSQTELAKQARKLANDYLNETGVRSIDFSEKYFRPKPCA